MSSDIIGIIDEIDDVSGLLRDDAEICGVITLPSYIDVPTYDGAYNVTPKMYEQTELATIGKKCTDNITVNRIPQYAVSNTAGGITAIIGDEYYGN
jgi:hypothetical protein